jgi:tRNA threonylcarbamoyladenosine biosynthesis protein TsaE
MKGRPAFHKQIPTEEDMLAWAGQLALAISEGAIIFLQGSLGAGKTTFARGFMRGLGYEGKVKSPTYTLVEPYEINGRAIYHFDLYRLKEAKELEQIGIEEYMSSSAICLIEWPTHGFPVLPEPDLICHLTFKEPGREMRIEAQTERGSAIIEQL